ncbi:hypothetical protein N656DRAFT_798132 [Canariomyces notabilis]|uniref:DUF6594 domain-containing protein n=1 Tax=Canariomyces notabilis TaxID=2074819 RepID=A0AAN6TDP9_9PEZI|nr:hypothetical protein N656DRAFT_798132 [Canariomyces arenarius]
MSSPYIPATPNLMTDFDASTVCTDSTGSPLTGSGSGARGTTATSVTNSPTLPRGAGSILPSPQPSGDYHGEKLEIGWPGLAQELARNPALEAFPRFRELNVKNLLYYQVEITELESQLKKIEWTDHYTGIKPQSLYAKRADKMLFAGRAGDEPDPVGTQRQLVYKIRQLLKEYNEALLQHAQITAMPHPNYVNIDCLQLKMHEDSIHRIRGTGEKAWGDPDKPKEVPSPAPLQNIRPLLLALFWKREARRDDRDLVAVNPPPKLDNFTYWISHDFIPFYHVHIRPKLRDTRKKIRKFLCQWNDGVQDSENQRREGVNTEPVVYRRAVMLQFTSGAATVVACLLPTLAIGILTTAETRLQRLLYIGGFTALFAIGVQWLADANTSRVQVFTATAAFSAVLVVFVQGQ